MSTSFGWMVPVAALGMLLIVILPTWYVGFDGTGYLALASNLKESAAYVSPDGQAMVVRGPGYPLVLAVGLAVGTESSGQAMIASRLVLVVSGLVAALATWRVTSSQISGLVAGSVLMTQPMLLPAGALDFFPDGLGALLSLLAVVSLLATTVRRKGPWLFLVAGLLVSLAFVTKESYALMMVGAALWILTRPLSFTSRMQQLGWVAAGFAPIFVLWTVYGLNATGTLPGLLPNASGIQALAVIAVVPVGALLLIAAAGVVPEIEVRLPVWAATTLAFLVVVLATTRSGMSPSAVYHFPKNLARLMSSQAYLGWTIAVPIVLFGLAVVGYRSWADSDSRALFVTVAGGIGGIYFHIATSGAVIRNGVMLPMIAVVFAGVAVSGCLSRRSQSRGMVKVGLVMTAVAAVIVGGTVAMVRLSDSVDSQRLTAEAGQTTDAAAWFVENTADARVVGTPSYFQSVWRLGQLGTDVELLPIYNMPRDSWERGNRTFDRSYDWLGRTHDIERSGPAVAYSFNGNAVSAVFAEDIAAASVSNQYLVISGNTRYPASAADGGIVLLLLEDSAAVRPVFVSHIWGAQWVVIFEFIGEVDVGSAAPLVRWFGVVPAGVSGAGMFNATEYPAAVVAALTSLSLELYGRP